MTLGVSVLEKLKISQNFAELYSPLLVLNKIVAFVLI